MIFLFGRRFACSQDFFQLVRFLVSNDFIFKLETGLIGFLVLVDMPEALFDFSADKCNAFVLSGAERLIEGAKHKHKSYNALLPVDDFVLLRRILERQNRAHEVGFLVFVKIFDVIFVGEGEFIKILPERQTLVALP